MPDFVSKLREFLSGLDEAPNAETFANALQAARQPYFQEIFNRGHGVAVNKHSDREAELTQKLEEAKAALSDKEEAIERLKNAKPDAAELNQEWQERLDKVEAKHQEEVENLKGRMVEERRQRAKSDLRSRLSAALDPDYAEIVAERHMKRIDHGDDGGIVVYHEDSQIPLQASDGKTPLDVLAEEIVGSAPPKFKKSGADSGSGLSNGSPPASGSSKNQWDRLRESAVKEREDKKQAGPSLEERLGLTATS